MLEAVEHGFNGRHEFMRRYVSLRHGRRAATAGGLPPLGAASSAESMGRPRSRIVPGERSYPYHLSSAPILARFTACLACVATSVQGVARTGSVPAPAMRRRARRRAPPPAAPCGRRARMERGARSWIHSRLGVRILRRYVYFCRCLRTQGSTYVTSYAPDLVQCKAG